MLDGLPALPKLNSGFVDVRDVADLHVRAMTHPAASGEAVSGHRRIEPVAGRVAAILREAGASGTQVPARTLPSWLMRVVALFSPKVKQLVPLLG
jgi:dihydroflavonol-4-reductase